jgi:hypothetical protein
VTDRQDIESAPPKEAGPIEAEPIVPSEDSAERRKSNRRRWRERQSVHALRREALKDHAAWADWDRRDNGETRLPDGEEVRLAGVVLAEVFTPSTVSALRKGLEDFPGARDKDKEEWIALLTKSRSAAGAGGWASLGVVRRSGETFGFLGPIDPDLPDGIEAVWPYLFFPTPSLTVIVATFTLADQAGDLSDLLRADYHAQATEVRVRVNGRFGRVRAHIPWARPRLHGASWSLRTAEDQKRLACESLITRREADCWTWLAGRFPGGFSAEKSSARPAVRLLLTKESVPFSDRGRWLAPAGLSFAPGIWRSTDPAGWFLKFGDWPRDRRFTITAAARSQDAARDHGGGESGDTTWYLTQDFAVDQSPFVARWAMTCLLSLYTDRLAELRDRAGTRRRVSRPVRQGRDLDRYLVGDGLDASTVVSDLEGFTRHLSRFRLHVPEYSEYLDGYPGPLRSRQPAELVPSMREQLQAQAETLGRDTAATTVNIRASAELRQSMANTRLQRVILCLTVLAITVAIISLVVALHASH